MSYQAQIPAGGTKRLVKTFDRRRDAERWLIEQQSALARGEFIDPRAAATPFRELVATWERTRAAKLAPKTRERYGSVTRPLPPPRVRLYAGRTAHARRD